MASMYTSIIKILTGVMSLRSKVFSEYFNTLMKNHNIKSIRNGMKVLIFYCYCEIVSSHFTQPGVIFRPIVALCAFCVFFLIFAVTVKVEDSSVMITMSSLMVLVCMGYTVLIATDFNEIMETHYSLTIVIILMMYTLFRLRFMITMLLSMVYMIIFVAIGNYRLKFNDMMNTTSHSGMYLRDVRHLNWYMVKQEYFIVGQSILFVLIYCTGFYLRFFNTIRRKSAFLKLAQYSEAKMKLNSAIEVQIYWIEAIMPSSVKNEFLKQITNKDMFNVVYCKKFENVSVLFADIVGFTVMSSNKTAAQLVYLLNDLYNRFDEHGKMTNCEKIGTLGDCYYCVSGCPVARPDHATCCIEMGLGMCRLILKFNKDHMESVNMRVGVHSGKVIAAIIGNHRFRFDVFSNDVIVANSLESSGQAGLVHISEDTYKLARHAYVFRAGENLEIKKETMFGLSGMVQKVTTIKTFFVIPNVKIKRKSISQSVNSRVQNNANASRNVKITGDLFGDSAIANKRFQRKDAKIKGDLNLIRGLQRDPERPVEFFQNPPMSQFFLTFKDKEIEAHYLNHSMDQLKRLQIDSIKIAPLIDSVACIIYSTIILLACNVMMPSYQWVSINIILIYGSGVLVTIIVAWTSLVFKSEISLVCFQYIFYFLHHPISRLIFGIYLSSMPSLLILSISKPGKEMDDYQYVATYFTLTLFAMIGHCIFTGAFSNIKHISTAFFTILSVVKLLNESHIMSTKKQIFDSCTSFLINEMNVNVQRYDYNFSFQLAHICLLIYYLTRENEKNIRIHFYASREAEIRNDEAKREKRIAESLLYNIIPKYVFAQIMTVKANKASKNMRFSYAHAIPKAGVLFACISNFFNSYYREDYRGGEVALKVLHTMICTFDNLLRKPIYKQVEKIKTINDCYMVASGLNTNSDTSLTESHLITLMQFAFDMQANMYAFNKGNMVGTDIFKLKIGYNFGPVTAGIIGNSKPLYDIWGDTVNVASRMYSTAPSGFIQVPDYVETHLNPHFEFELRGSVTIKGKGEMITYLATKPFDNTFIDRRIRPT